MKKFLIYALILGSIGWTMADGTSNTISTRNADLMAQIESL